MDHTETYKALESARQNAESGHYALEEGEYHSALEYIEQARQALVAARINIETEITP